jgi:hypothetical protein
MGLKEHYQQLKSDLGNVKRTLSLTAALPWFFRERLTLQQAKDEIKRILDIREKRFLELVRSEVYERPESPYLRLLNHAGCEFADLQARVNRYGLEATLAKLAAEGVYFTSEEFKGKTPVVRGRQSFRVSPGDFEFSAITPGFTIQSSGTTNRPIRSQSHLNYLAFRAPITAVFFSSHNLFSYSHAMYEAILPGAGGINNLLIYAKLGIAAERWFARKIPVNNWLEGQYHFLTTYLIVLNGKWFGPGFPTPEMIDIMDVHRIVAWVIDNNQNGKLCCITTAASNATRIARNAWEMGVSLAGTKFIVSGEPFTETKRALIERVGASGISRYAFGGGASVGFGCANPALSDDVHVDKTRLALISHPIPLSEEGPPIYPLLLTSLYPSATSRLLVNVENGDYATLETRDCHCAMGDAGFNLHVQHIRSYEKFTSEGMNYFYGDLFELFEQLLPAEFGGGPGDYQLVEEEDSRGQSRLTLVVHPEVGDLDEAKALARLRSALASGSQRNRFMSEMWQGAGTFRIRRAVPYASARGKILPLHIKHLKS